MERQTIAIDESKCDGCGACARACAEGVIEVIDGVARLVSEDHCDGLGACVGDCPNGAISLVTVTRELEPTQVRGCPLWDISLDRIGTSFGTQQTARSQESAKSQETAESPKTAAPALSASQADATTPTDAATPAGQTATSGSRAVPNWPIQASLVSPTAKWLVEANLLVCADCVAYTCPDFHSRHLPGKALLVGCPKFDDRERFVSRLAEILSVAHLRSIEALHMDVACCSGLSRLIDQAQARAKTRVPVATTVVGVDGKVL